MRVATITVYKQATYQLRRLTSDLSEANEVVSTNSRINACADDPTALAQTLDIDSSIACTVQCQANVQQGQTVLTTAETALDAMADQLLELQLLSSQLANASASSQERTDAADSMQVYLDQLLDLANAQAYGGYVFAGNDNQTPPFSYDDPDHPAGVTYSGSDTATSIKTGQDTELSMEICGCDLFYADEIIVDTTNNSLVFSQDPGSGVQDIRSIEVEIPSGSYTREELAAAVEDAMNKASFEEGYGIVYEVDFDESDNTFSIGTDGSDEGIVQTVLEAVQTQTVRISNLAADDEAYDDLEIEILNPSVLTKTTPEPEGTAPITLTYTEEGTWTVENDPGYGLAYEIEGEGQTLELDLDDDGSADISLDLNADPEPGTTLSFDIVDGYENNSILMDMGFDEETVEISPLQSSFEVAAAFVVAAGANDSIDFTETLSEDGTASAQLTAVIEPGTYTDPESYARAVEAALEEASAENGSRVNYSVIYDSETKGFTIREDTSTGRQLASFDLCFSSGTHSDSSAAADLGFSSSDISAGPVTGGSADWSIFDPIFDLQAALGADDVDGIQRAITRLENHYENLTSSMAVVGRAYDSLTSTGAAAVDAKTSLTEQRSGVADADTVASVMTLNATQTVYEAALGACSKIMDLSLADYL